MRIRTLLGRTIAVSMCLALSQATLVPVVSASETAPHVVDQGAVVDRMLSNARTREERIDLFERALSNPKVERQAALMGLDAGKVRRAIPSLSDQELKDVAQRARASKDVAAGYYDDDSGLVALGVVLLIAVTAVVIYLVDHPR